MGFTNAPFFYKALRSDAIQWLEQKLLHLELKHCANLISSRSSIVSVSLSLSVSQGTSSTATETLTQ